MGSGYFAGDTWPGRFNQLLSPTLKQLKQTALQTNAYHSVLRTVTVIFLHNLFAALFVMIITGIVTIGVYPAWALWMNGLTMGYMVATTASQLNVPGWRVLVFGMLPHGVFELPAFIWCGVIGIHLGYVAIHSVWHILRTRLFHLDEAGRSNRLSFRHQFLHALKLLPYPIGLLLLAATIEGTVTPHLILTGIPHIH